MRDLGLDYLLMLGLLAANQRLDRGLSDQSAARADVTLVTGPILSNTPHPVRVSTLPPD